MIQEQIKNILSLLCETTIYAHKEIISANKFIKYEPELHKFAGSIVFPPKSYISYKGMAVTESGGTYWLKISATDDLKSILQKANLPSKFCTLLVNQKFNRSVTIYADDELKNFFYCSEFQTLYGKNRFDANSVDPQLAEEAIQEINKLLLLKRIKYS